jgi:diphosphomevalonate decarboxylase
MFTNTIDNYNLDISSYEVGFSSPSNIALVKYWGKFGRQYPKNPSLSITLDNAHTKTSVKFSKRERSQDISLTFKFEGEEKQSFSDKIVKFLAGVLEELPFLTDYHLDIESSNTFPHSSGIASSASSMSALAMCLCDFEKRISLREVSEEDFLKKASYIARLGSGSASRSLFPEMAAWGKTELFESSDDYAVTFSDFHEMYKGMHDSVAIISKGEKAVSSRAGHALMNTHPFAQTRFESANNNMQTLLESLKQGDFEKFTEVVEIEALELHGLMMNSRPSFILMEPNTLEAINRIRNFRKKTGTKVCFTLDAGPNVHILYPNSEFETVRKFIEEEIKPLAQDNLVIHDQMGMGAKLLKSNS